MHPLLVDEFLGAVECLCQHYDQSNPGDSLVGLGLMCGDDVASFGPFLLSRSKIPEDAPPDYRFNPVDWDCLGGSHCLLRLHGILGKMRVAQDDSAFRDYVRCVFDSAAEAFLRLDLRKRYGQDLFVTMGGVDPTSLLESEERRFVEKTNSPAIFTAWLKDFA